MALNKQTTSARSSASEAIIDQGLRSYMLRVYNYMCSGLFLTGIVSLLVFQAAGGYNITFSSSSGFVGVTSFGNLLFNTGFKWIVALSPLAVMFYFFSAAKKMNVAKCQAAFWIFSSLFGASLSTLLVQFTGMSIARVFFITAGTFGVMSIYGYTTKRDLTKLGSFLMMGLFGIIIASVVNWFVQSSMMYFIVSIIGVLVFVGFTAYDTQKIKNMYLASDSGELMGKKAVMGALTLYLDFINLFIMLLRLFGQRR